VLDCGEMKQHARGTNSLINQSTIIDQEAGKIIPKKKKKKLS
jgi:hypothetical protein